MRSAGTGKASAVHRTAYRAFAATAAVAGVFVLVVTVIMAVNATRLKAVDPVNSKLLETLRREYLANPDEEARRRLRDLDLILRRAQFSSQAFAANGARLLLAGSLVLLVSLRAMASLSRRPPYPGPFPGPRRPMDSAAASRRAVAGLGVLFLAGSAYLILAGPTEKAAPDTEGSKRPQVQVPWDDRVRHWPSFRGPDGLGMASGERPPTEWDGAEGRGVLWKVPVPRPGFSSPVVWKDRVFVTGADESAREVYCYDADTGEIVWRHEVSGVPDSPTDLPRVTADTGHAAPTAATDGVRVYAAFSNGDLAAVDFSGRRAWARNLGRPENPYGHASSLLTYRGLILVQYDQAERSRVLAIRGESGQTAWERARDVAVSWSSPILISREGRDELVLSGNPFVIGYDPLTGEERWRVECLGGEVASSPAWDGERVFAANEYATMAAIGLAGGAKILWRYDEGLPEVSSPLAAGGIVVVGNGVGVLSCLDAATGRLLWRREFFEGFYGSPVAAGGLIYIVDRGGGTRIFEAAAEYREAGYPQLGEPSSCTPAAAGGRLYLRGQSHLFCVAPEARR